MSEALTERLNLPVAKSLIEALDEWRRHQPDIPARATAARRLIEIGLEANRKKESRGAQ